jgi:hypothetical protein
MGIASVALKEGSVFEHLGRAVAAAICVDAASRRSVNRHAPR